MLNTQHIETFWSDDTDAKMAEELKDVLSTEVSSEIARFLDDLQEEEAGRGRLPAHVARCNRDGKVYTTFDINGLQWESEQGETFPKSVDLEVDVDGFVFYALGERSQSRELEQNAGVTLHEGGYTFRLVPRYLAR